MKQEYHFTVVVVIEDGEIVPNSVYVDLVTTAPDNVFDVDNSRWQPPNYDIEDKAVSYLSSLLRNGQNNAAMLDEVVTDDD
jgi:hypothetical protein